MFGRRFFLQLFGFEIVHSATGWSPTEMSDFLSCLHKKKEEKWEQNWACKCNMQLRSLSRTMSWAYIKDKKKSGNEPKNSEKCSQADFNKNLSEIL